LKASVMSATLSPTVTLDQSSARRRVHRDLRYKVTGPLNVFKGAVSRDEHLNISNAY
jgi:hypothetical protein